MSGTLTEMDATLLTILFRDMAISIRLRQLSDFWHPKQQSDSTSSHKCQRLELREASRYQKPFKDHKRVSHMGSSHLLCPSVTESHNKRRETPEIVYKLLLLFCTRKYSMMRPEQLKSQRECSSTKRTFFRRQFNSKPRPLTVLDDAMLEKSSPQSLRLLPGGDLALLQQPINELGGHQRALVRAALLLPGL